MDQQKEKVRDKILRCAAQLIGKKGYAEVSVRDIAESAGVSLGQITYHFKSKDTLFIEIVKILTDNFFNDFAKAISGEKSGIKKSAAVLRKSRKSLENSPNDRKMLMDFSNMAIWSKDFADEFKLLFKKMENALKTESGNASKQDDVGIIQAISAISIGVSMLYLITGDKNVLNVFNKVAEALEANNE